MHLVLSMYDVESNEYACFIFDRSPIFVGRDPVNTIVIDRPEISQWHLAVSFSERGATVRGMAAATPTFLDGRVLIGDRPVCISSRAFLSFSALRVLVEVGYTEAEVRTKARGTLTSQQPARRCRRTVPALARTPLSAPQASAGLDWL